MKVRMSVSDWWRGRWWWMPTRWRERRRRRGIVARFWRAADLYAIALSVAVTARAAGSVGDEWRVIEARIRELVPDPGEVWVLVSLVVDYMGRSCEELEALGIEHARRRDEGPVR
jgi:hypothetical protein